MCVLCVCVCVCVCVCLCTAFISQVANIPGHFDKGDMIPSNQQRRPPPYTHPPLSSSSSSQFKHLRVPENLPHHAPKGPGPDSLADPYERLLQLAEGPRGQHRRPVPPNVFEGPRGHPRGPPFDGQKLGGPPIDGQKPGGFFKLPALKVPEQPNPKDSNDRLWTHSKPVSRLADPVRSNSLAGREQDTLRNQQNNPKIKRAPVAITSRPALQLGAGKNNNNNPSTTKLTNPSLGSFREEEYLAPQRMVKGRGDPMARFRFNQVTSDATPSNRHLRDIRNSQ